MKLSVFERLIYAAAFVRALEDRHRNGVTAWAREEASIGGSDVITIWERGIAVMAVEDARGAVTLHRIALREMKP